VQGRWVILGVEDQTRKVHGFDLPSGTDPQSHFANILRPHLDTLPPFVAELRAFEGGQVGVLRVYRSSETPVLVREAGVI
jgi:hypothetical protein